MENFHLKTQVASSLLKLSTNSAHSTTTATTKLFRNYIKKELIRKKSTQKINLVWTFRTGEKT